MSQQSTKTSRQQKQMTWKQAWEEIEKLVKYREEQGDDLLISDIQAREQAVQKRLPAYWLLYYCHERRHYALLHIQTGTGSRG